MAQKETVWEKFGAGIEVTFTKPKTDRGKDRIEIRLNFDSPWKISYSQSSPRIVIVRAEKENMK